MKKNLGIIITLIGVLIVVSSLLFTPTHALNPADSRNGVNAAAPEFFGGLIIAGIGVVIFANAAAKDKRTA